MASSEDLAVRRLRWTLGLSGAVATLVAIGLGLDGSRGMIVVGAGVGAVALGSVPGLGRRTRATGALLLALLALYLRYTGHMSTPFPAVDWIRPRGMDVWPGLLQTAGMLLLLVTAPAVLRGTGGRVLRCVAGLGVLLAVVYWFFPQHFVIDELGPAQAGRASMPVVVDGHIEPRSWGRRGVPATPVSALPELLENEARLASIAHGMGHEAARLAGQESTGQFRATLWGIQRAVTPVVLGAGVLSMGVALVMAVGLVGRWRIPKALRHSSTGVLLAALLVPPASNLLLRAAGLAGGLAEAQEGAWISLILSSTMLCSGLLAWTAGESCVSVQRGEE